MCRNEKRMRRCCFTGHRPEKLMGGMAHIQMKLQFEIERAIADGFGTFITGMARGIDLIAAEFVLAMQKNGMPTHLICASPYVGFETRWSVDWQERYRNVLNSADIVRYASPVYNRDCFQARNEWMVDHSSRLIAVYNGSPVGTQNTIEYARKRGLDIKIIYEEML